MATQTNPIVISRDAGTLSRPNEYMGLIKYIPVNFVGDYAAADTLVFTQVFGQNTKLVGIHLTNTDLGTAVSIDIGVTGNPDSIIDGADVSSAGTVDYQGVAVDVSDKAIIGTVQGAWDSGTVSGYLLITNDW
jgi:hypothetical protein